MPWEPPASLETAIEAIRSRIPLVDDRPDARVGVDAGGTFTDVVVLDAGRAQSLKVPTDAGLAAGLAQARPLVNGAPAA